MKTILIISYSPLHSDPRILRQVNCLKDKYKLLTIGNAPINDNNIIFYNAIKTYKKQQSVKIKKRFNKNRLKKKIRHYFYLIRKKLFFKKLSKRFKIFHKLYIHFLIIINSLFKLNIKKVNEHFSSYLFRGYNIDYINSQNIQRPDIIIANDCNGLYLAYELNKINNWNTKVYFDAHEYAPTEYINSLKWIFFTQPLIIWALKNSIKCVSIMSTVCDGIAKEYEKYFKFPTNTVRIITNASTYNDTLKPNPINNGIIRLIHHGISQKERKLELMIKMMKYLNPEKYELNFMITKADPVYYDYLLKLAKKNRNINFIEPVSFSEIISTINNYDIGVYILKPTSFNQKHALPNKFFEFIQARLAIAIGPSIEMVKIIDQYNLGVHSKYFTPKSLAKTISQLTTQQIMEYKKNADKYAKELSAEENMNKIRSIIAELDT